MKKVVIKKVYMLAIIVAIILLSSLLQTEKQPAGEISVQPKEIKLTGFAFSQSAEGRELFISLPEESNIYYDGKLKVFNKNQPAKISASGISCNPTRIGRYIVQTSLGISIAKGQCNSAEYSKSEIVANYKNELEITLPSEIGVYCIAAGCGTDESFNSNSNKFTQIKTTIEIANLGDVSNLVLSSRLNRGGDNCGAVGYKCSSEAASCVWQNSNLHPFGACRKNKETFSATTTTAATTTSTAARALPTTKAPVTTQPSEVAPKILKERAPDKIWPGRNFDFEFSIKAPPQPATTTTTIPATIIAPTTSPPTTTIPTAISPAFGLTDPIVKIDGIDPSRCEAFITDNRMESKNIRVSCTPAPDDIGKDFKVEIVEKTLSGQISSVIENVKIEPPPEKDTKPPTCSANFGSNLERAETTPSESARLYLNCEDNFKSIDDSAGKLTLVEVFAGAKGSDIFFPVQKIDVSDKSEFAGLVECDQSCKTKAFLGESAALADKEIQGKELQFKIFSTDAAGNKAELKTDSIKIKDMEPPTCELLNKEAVSLPRGANHKLKAKCSDNTHLAGIKFYWEYKKDSNEKKESNIGVGEYIQLAPASGQEVDYGLTIPQDSKIGSTIYWRVSAWDDDGNEIHAPDIKSNEEPGIIIVKDDISPEVEILDYPTLVKASQKSAFVFTASDLETGLGRVSILVNNKEIPEKTVEFADTESAKTSIELDKKDYLTIVGSTSINQSQNLKWLISAKDKDGNEKRSDEKLFTLEPTCQDKEGIIDDKPPRIKSQPQTLDEAEKLFAGETPEISTGKKIKLQVTAEDEADAAKDPGKKCNGLSAALLEINTTAISGSRHFDSKGKKTEEKINFDLSIPTPQEQKLPESGVDDRVFPGSAVKWKFVVDDINGNFINTSEKIFRLKDEEAPEITGVFVNREKASSLSNESVKFSGCIKDWNVNPPSYKIGVKANGIEISNENFIKLRKSKGERECIDFEYFIPNAVSENQKIELSTTAKDAAGLSSKSKAKSFVIANPPEWTGDRSPREANYGEKVKLSKFWKDDTEIKEAELWIDEGDGFEFIEKKTFDAGFKEGWIDFYYKVPRIEGLKSINWMMKVRDIYDNEGSVDPQLLLSKDEEPPTYTEQAQQSDKIYKEWGNYLSVKAADNIALASAEYYFKEGSKDFKLLFTERLVGTEFISAYNWTNENNFSGVVEWYAVLKDADGNSVKTETKSFEVSAEKAGANVSMPAVPKKLKRISPNLSIVPAGGKTQQIDYLMPAMIFAFVVFVGAAGYYYYQNYYKKPEEREMLIGEKAVEETKTPALEKTKKKEIKKKSKNRKSKKKSSGVAY